MLVQVFAQVKSVQDTWEVTTEEALEVTTKMLPFAQPRRKIYVELRQPNIDDTSMMNFIEVLNNTTYTGYLSLLFIGRFHEYLLCDQYIMKIKKNGWVLGNCINLFVLQ